MNKSPRWLAGRTILLIEKTIGDALPLQDAIVGQGGKVLTAYTRERALTLARVADVSGAVINPTVDLLPEIVELLEKRHVPCVLRPLHSAPAMSDTTQAERPEMAATQAWQALEQGMWMPSDAADGPMENADSAIEFLAPLLAENECRHGSAAGGRSSL
jgi:hypothetical protein